MRCTILNAGCGNIPECYICGVRDPSFDNPDTMPVSLCVSVVSLTEWQAVVAFGVRVHSLTEWMVSGDLMTTASEWLKECT